MTKEQRGPVYWNEKTDSEDVLYVCQSCGAELHTDCVGETCPACGVKIEDEPEAA